MAVFFIVILSCLVFTDVSCQTFQGTVSIKARWKLLFIGAVEFDVDQRLSDGWTIYMNFTDPIDNFQIWDAELISCDESKRHYVFGNKPFNVDLPAGSKLHVVIMGNANRSTNLEASAILTQEPPPVAIGELESDLANHTTYDYAKAMQLANLFYEIQRSGRLPTVRNIPWRYDSALYDMSEHGEDLTGGYYDAGDHLKFSLTIAFAMGLLSWGYIEFPDAYESHGMTDKLMTTIRWGTDYLMKCHTEKDEFIYQVGNAGLDHGYWGRPEDMTMERPAYFITSNAGEEGTEPTVGSAAALAAAAVAFKDHDPVYSITMIAHARELYDLGNKYRANYQNNGYYKSSAYGDELCYSAVWLYKATGEERYLDDAKQHYEEFGLAGRGYSFSWGDARPACQLLLYLETGDISYYEHFTSFLDKWLPGGGIPYTEKGLVFRESWGSLRYAGGVSFLALVAANEGIRANAYRRFARSQIGYILGDTGRSFLIGFGKNYPQRPHHRSSSCPEPPELCTYAALRNPGPNPHICYGAMVGGPTDLKDTYDDDRQNYYENEVTLDYNAGLLSSLAGLEHLKLTGNLE
ncbi:endoglucanase E-4-like [Ptychodera flava]|uniref:endoglucanase E-4-like n=1 Tax=Ptychodera flava TaxID=63121 RepID=UPI00396A2F31